MLTQSSFALAGFGPAIALGFTMFGCSSPPQTEPATPKTDATAAAATATAAATAAEPQEIPKEPVASGKDCAKALAQCGGGVCAVGIDNTCDKPVTCNLFIMSVCQADNDLIQVKARKRETFAAASKSEVSLGATCTTGRVVNTKVQSLECQ